MGQTPGQGIAERVVLDTSVCIEIIKNRQRGISIANQLFTSEVFLASISTFELLLRRTNLGAVEELLREVNLLGFDEKSARKAAEVKKELNANGTPIGLSDIFIAAIALANGCALATLNVKDFSKIKGLKLLKV
ncbi:MAG TPA: type II toxin-antitoxin system VapC family toxin [Candidatus Nanoarchaeia archaeon]|nr:type II toxin-antitoxin system VapC family toxin [Candidatus Nanoarchaeia archaeon]